MELKRNKEITLKAWLNEIVISDENWEVYSEDAGDILYVFAKDAVTGNQLKLKIEKTGTNREVSSVGPTGPTGPPQEQTNN